MDIVVVEIVQSPIVTDEGATDGVGGGGDGGGGGDDDGGDGGGGDGGGGGGGGDGGGGTMLIAIAAGAGGGILLLALCIFCWWRRRARQPPPPPADKLTQTSVPLPLTGHPSSKPAPPPDPPHYAMNAPALPAGWTQMVDPSSGQTYYYDMASGASSWERPAAPARV